MSTVEKHLIQVIVTFNQNGAPFYTFNSIFGNDQSAENPLVETGDQVAWQVVQKAKDKTISYPPYALTFVNPSVFGTSSLSVPGGGVSPFLQVVSLNGSTKYTLTVQGVTPAMDPTIEVDNGIGHTLVGKETGAAATTSQYEIFWDDTDDGTALQWRSVGGTFAHFPSTGISLDPGDIVTFLLLPVGKTFQIDFDTPPFAPLFNGESSGFTIRGSQQFTASDQVTYESTGPQKVVSVSQQDQTFDFNFEDESGDSSGSGTLNLSS
jgi:hypothetical protein